ncbi:MAG: hypothetical protein ACT4PP_12960 [Sporichthyaceae bacterium]
MANRLSGRRSQTTITAVHGDLLTGAEPLTPAPACEAGANGRRARPRAVAACACHRIVATARGREP